MNEHTGHFDVHDEDAGGSDPDGTPARFPWPPAENEPAAAAAVRTWTAILFEPTRFFRSMPAGAPLGPVVTFYLLVGVLAAGVDLFWTSVLPPPESAPAWLEPFTRAPGNPLIGFLLSPLYLIIALWIGTALTHATLVVVGGARTGFRASLRVMAYSYAPALLAVVPWAGSVVGFLWMLVCGVVGLRETHGTSTGRAAAAVLIPAVLILGLLVMVLLLGVLLIGLTPVLPG